MKIYATANQYNEITAEVKQLKATALELQRSADKLFLEMRNYAEKELKDAKVQAAIKEITVSSKQFKELKSEINSSGRSLQILYGGSGHFQSVLPDLLVNGYRNARGLNEYVILLGKNTYQMYAIIPNPEDV